ncbi:MAG TPA: hypothetical protein VKU01_31100 [Bryobacteraceae bacterium]|nr:hypothetical protein [Bryobacteraceae bacterium]
MPTVSSVNEVHPASWSQIYLGVLFTTLATLILELSLTRIFSVVFYYHFAFLAISIALFGLGAGGVFSYVVAPWRGGFFAKLGTLAALNSVAVLVSLSFVITRQGEMGVVTLAFVYFASALPFFLSGTIVSLAVAETIERIDRVYFFDLLGAAIGCLVLIPFLKTLGGPNTVIAAGVFFAVSAAIWYNLAGSMRGRAAGVVLALTFVVLIAANGRLHWIDVRYAKGQAIGKELFTKWNPISRIGIRREPYSDLLSIVIDADAATGIASFDFDHLTGKEHFELLRQGPGFPYLIRPGAKTMVIGPGGGWDVSRALASGSHDITAVEINDIIANTIMRDQMAKLSRNLYLRPDVHVFVEDGRSFVRRSPEKYQVIQATLVDTWASTAAGAFALSENNLYTSDAFRDYLSHLTDDGLLAFTRWGFEPPRESLRLLSLAMRAFQELGEPDPASHVVVLREDSRSAAGYGARDTVLVFRKPISTHDLETLKTGIAGTKGVQLIYAPGEKLPGPFSDLLNSRDPEQFWNQYQFDVSPVSDDRPFFFYTVQPRDVLKFLNPTGNAEDNKINKALPLLFGLVAVSILATIIVLALPPLLLGTKLPAEKGVRRFLVYFACIGTGYILIQVALIQKFVLFLGHPTYALTVIVFSMLISSGLGSFYSRKLALSRLNVILGVIAVCVAVLAFVAAPIGEYGVGLPLPLKMLITVALIAPAGFLMGMPFPTGLTRLESRYPQAVRWAWALNAASSVLGSAGAIFLAIYLGLRVTLLIGGALYLGAMLVARTESRIPKAVHEAEPVLSVH